MCHRQPLIALLTTIFILFSSTSRIVMCQTSVPVGPDSGAGSSQSSSSGNSFEESHDQFNEATRNLTASVNILSEKIDGLSKMLNTTIGLGLVKELGALTLALNDVVGKKMITSLSGVQSTLNATVYAAQQITKQVDTTAKTTMMDLNNTVSVSVNLVNKVLDKVDDVEDTVKISVRTADGWVRTIDGWAVKVIFAAIALTTLLASGIVFTVGCCALCSCLQVRRRQRHASDHKDGELTGHDHEEQAEELRLLIHPTVLKTTKSITDLSSKMKLTDKISSPSIPTSPKCKPDRSDEKHNEESDKVGLLKCAAKIGDSPGEAHGPNAMLDDDDQAAPHTSVDDPSSHTALMSPMSPVTPKSPLIVRGFSALMGTPKPPPDSSVE